ncbi:hypothetical protein EC973_004456 [Apophysomyces ossiformis]|uniref:Uncharacterized protein n=1 Tax=Apophysomyces ossiformis TaxID=679940 RepID=A0A8H7BV70_9FUNG|nr:hypothetical protein EC973_004456 [Apophysomyces ossiformis]
MDTENMPILKNLSTVLENYSGDNFIRTLTGPNSKSPSEMTYYQKLAQLLNITLWDTVLDNEDGERICKVSKRIGEENARFNDGSMTIRFYGWYIDFIISSSGTEFEQRWKRRNVTAAVALKQQAKNVRMNKAVLTNLLAYPIDDNLTLWEVVPDVLFFTK